MFCMERLEHSILIKWSDVFLWHPIALKCGAKWLGLRRAACSLAQALELCACMWTRGIGARSTPVKRSLKGDPHPPERPRAATWCLPVQHEAPLSPPWVLQGHSGSIRAVISRSAVPRTRRASKHRDKFLTWEVRNKPQVMESVKCGESAVLTLFRVESGPGEVWHGKRSAGFWVRPTDSTVGAGWWGTWPRRT